MEQYYYWQQKNTGTVVPKLFYQSPKKWYTEFRYNYEEVQTGSVHFGKQFGFKKIPQLKITPSVGYLFGNLNGASTGTIITFETDKFSFSSEPLYVFSFKDKYENYLYSWTELTYQVNSFFYSGLAVQQTKAYGENNFFEPGVMAGFSIKNFEIPIYCFNTTSGTKNFVLGVNWRWEK
jgi:hypothetical protein